MEEFAYYNTGRQGAKGSHAHWARACAASTSLSTSRKTRIQREAEALNASPSNLLRDITLRSQNIMNPPPFLRALVPMVRPSDRRTLSSSTDGERQAFARDAEERGEKETQPTSSAPSTSATVTADASAKAADCIRLVANEAKASLLPSTAMHASRTSAAPSTDGMHEAKVATVAASASSLARLTTPRGRAGSLIHRRSPVVGAVDRRELLARRQHPCSGPSDNPKHQGTSDASEIDVLMQKGGYIDTSNTAAADLPIARLATALAASSLRLAAAAEEGLQSSPPQLRAGWSSRPREPPSAENNTVNWPSTSDLVGRATRPPRRRTNRSAFQAALHFGAAVAEDPSIGSSAASSKGSQGGATQNVSSKKTPDVCFHQHTRKSRLCCSRVLSASTPAEKMRQTWLKSGPLSASPARTVGHSAAPLFQRDVQRCTEGGTSQAPSSASSGSCKSCRQRRVGRASFPRSAVSSFNVRPETPSNPLPREEHLQAACRSPLMKPPSPLSQEDQQQAQKQACSATVTSAPEEEQFSLLLQHSLGLLKREAARCFASSQASTKQKLWGELQQERLLRLQEQQEHQAAAATAAAELEFLRASRAGSCSRTERLLEISWSRKTADDDLRLLVCAWKAWLQHRRLVRARKQVARLTQQRRLLLLLLRTFLPWRAAASRCSAEQQQRRAQRLMQQEMQRLEQMHLEGKSRQQQQLLQLHQQLAGETWLRECLQQSLVGVVAGGTVGNLTRGESRIETYAKADGSITAPHGALKSKQKQKARDQKNQHHLPIRQESSLTVFGMHANPKGRKASECQLKQRQRLERGQAMQRRRQAWAMDAPTAEASGSDSESARSQLGAKNRRVKFVAEKMNLQHNQQLLLLASLLASSHALRPINGDQQNPRIPSEVSNGQENYPRLVSSAFAPASTCGAFSSKDLASALAGNPAVQASNASGTFRTLPEGAEPLGGNSVQGRSAGLFSSSPLAVDGHLPKGSRWTAATQFLYPS
ncbi:hypothetical protein ACSSS7_002617 [Eimeria intestinalis]